MFFFNALINCLHVCKLFQTAAPKLQANVKLPLRVEHDVWNHNTHSCTHTQPPPPRRARLCGWLTPPASGSYKTTQPPSSHSGFAAEGTRPPSATVHGVSISTGPCKPPPEEQTSMAPFEKSMEMMPFKQRKCLGNNLFGSLAHCCVYVLSFDLFIYFFHCATF